MKLKHGNSPVIAVLMQILMPGLGHVYWKDIMFGIFVFLVIMLASILYVVSLFIKLPILAKGILFTLPVLFYLFSFVDLLRTVRTKQKKIHQTAKSAIIVLLVGLLYQFLWPLAPVNFGLQNIPEVFVEKNTELYPLYSKGEILKASRLAYFLNIAVLDRPLFHSLPERFDIIRFEMGPGDNRCGVVIGLPGEEIEIAGGVLVIDGVPKLASTPSWLNLTGDWELTSIDGYSMLIATMRLGSVDKLYEVPLSKLHGKVSRLF